jgi:hypothetical protein
VYNGDIIELGKQIARDDSILNTLSDEEVKVYINRALGGGAEHHV